MGIVRRCAAIAATWLLLGKGRADGSEGHKTRRTTKLYRPSTVAYRWGAREWRNGYRGMRLQMAGTPVARMPWSMEQDRSMPPSPCRVWTLAMHNPEPSGR